MKLNQNKLSLLFPPSGMRVSTILHFVDFDFKISYQMFYDLIAVLVIA